MSDSIGEILKELLRSVGSSLTFAIKQAALAHFAEDVFRLQEALQHKLASEMARPASHETSDRLIVTCFGVGE
jgi:hypothetical protein